MYSPNIIDRSQYALEKALKIKLHRYSIEESQEITDALKKLIVKGKLTRALSPREHTFIQNERYLCKIDFRYYAERYAMIELDAAIGIGVGPFRLWESQELTLKLMAQIEEDNYQLYDDNDPCYGIKLANHKDRQLGSTTINRVLNSHRWNFWNHTRSMGASVDEPKVHEQMYTKDKVIYDNLPFFLKPQLKFDVKNKQLAFSIGSRILYQQANQQSGMGQGSQFDFSHLTEVASWPYPNVIELDFIPTLPQSRFTYCCLESTAQGRGDWWHEFTEAVRNGKMYGWYYVFWPWYINKSKYRAKPPTNWVPSQMAIKHAEQVARTSPEILGYKVELTKPQLFWYEMGYMNAREKGELNLFLMNFGATPEATFQFAGTGGFDTELIDEYRMQTDNAEIMSYEFIAEGN